MHINIHPGKVYGLQVSVKPPASDNWFEISFKDIIWDSHANNTIAVEYNGEDTVVEYNSMHFTDPDDNGQPVEFTCGI